MTNTCSEESPQENNRRSIRTGINAADKPNNSRTGTPLSLSRSGRRTATPVATIMADFASKRLGTEQAFHDRQARERAETFVQQPDQLQFTDDDYLDHESWIRPAFEQFGDVRDLRALDYGCGH